MQHLQLRDCWWNKNLNYRNLCDGKQDYSGCYDILKKTYLRT